MPVISTNSSALAALTFLNNNSAGETNKISQLASGSRIVQAADDAAGLAIGVQLQANVTVFTQDQTNVSQGSAILQSADGALAQISNVLQRMMALATEAASGQVTNTQRSQDINTEYTQLKGEISSIVSSTTYAGQTLLTGSFLSNVKFLVGTLSSSFITVSVAGVQATKLLGSGSLGVATTAFALASMNAVNSAINTVASDRAKIGAYESKFNFAGQGLQPSIENIAASASVMMDADVALVKSQLSSNDVRTQSAVAGLTQASQLPQELLRLIQS